MCGRYELSATPAELREHFGEVLPDVLWDSATPEGRYNIAPSQPCPIIRHGKREQRNVLEPLVWGFRPQWAKRGWINARDDRLFQTPAFKEAARKRRALVVATGWYEWQALNDKGKRPYYVRIGEPLAFAGVWTARKLTDEHWELSFAIVTTASVGALRRIHERMPLVMAPDRYAAWLDPATPRPESLLEPYAVERMKAHAVSTKVNDPRNDGPELTEPLDDAASAVAEGGVDGS